jgi:DNA-binding cell septation regulator SpoVG
MSIKIAKAYRPTGTTKVLLYADIIFFDSLETRGWRLLKNARGEFYVGYPNSPVGNGKRIRQVIPLTDELQKSISSRLIEVYEGLCGQVL